MANLWTTIFIGGGSIIAGNYVYQLMSNHDWAVAHERSFFQASALIVIGIMLSRTA